MKKLLSAFVLAGLTLALVMFAAGMVHAASMRFARVSESEGDVWVLRAGTDEWEPCGVNTPLGETDIVETEDDSYAEIQLDNGAIISLNQDTRVDFKRLIFNDEGGRTTVLGLPFGSAMIRVFSYRDPSDYLLVELPTGRVYVEEKAFLRIDVKGSGASHVLVYRGRGILEGKDGDVVIKKGRRGYLDSDGYLGPVKRLPKGKDYFYSWCLDNYEKYRRGESRRYLDDGSYYGGVYDLDRHGTWINVADYGYCWRPRVQIGWYPYHHGHWVWSIHWGWTWVSYEPWGWIPYHYGRWVRSWRWGWIWIPGHTWGPAWVVWGYYGSCVGWAPLGPWGYPYYYGYYGYNWPWTYVYRDSFYHPHGKYKYRRNRKYRHYEWGKKRYRYRDGKGHRPDEYKMTGPEEPKLALKNKTAAVADWVTPRTDKKILPGAVTEAPKGRTSSASVTNKKLPSKPRAVETERGKSEVQHSTREKTSVTRSEILRLPPKPETVETERGRSEVQRSTKDKPSVTRSENERLPQKPKTVETTPERKTEEHDRERKENTRRSEPQSYEWKEPSEEVERPRADRNEEKRASPPDRTKTREKQQSKETGKTSQSMTGQARKEERSRSPASRPSKMRRSH